LRTADLAFQHLEVLADVEFLWPIVGHTLVPLSLMLMVEDRKLAAIFAADVVWFSRLKPDFTLASRLVPEMRNSDHLLSL
jgi:hypothetical protein